MFFVASSYSSYVSVFLFQVCCVPSVYFVVMRVISITIICIIILRFWVCVCHSCVLCVFLCIMLCDVGCLFLFFVCWISCLWFLCFSLLCLCWSSALKNIVCGGRIISVVCFLMVMFRIIRLCSSYVFVFWLVIILVICLCSCVCHCLLSVSYCYYCGVSYCVCYSSFYCMLSSFVYYFVCIMCLFILNVVFRHCVSYVCSSCVRVFLCVVMCINCINCVFMCLMFCCVILYMLVCVSSYVHAYVLRFVC